MNKNIIIAILIIIIIAVVGIFVFHPGATTEDGKLNTQINFLSQSNLKNGDQIQIELKDAQGNTLANQVVNFTYQANGQDEKYSVVTDNQGKAFLVLSNEDAGQHQVNVSYAGDAKYNPCTASQTITIEEGESSSTESTPTNSTASTIAHDNRTSSSSSGSSSSSSSSGSSHTYYYDYETGDTYDENGIIVSGQNEGASIYDVRNNPPVVDEDGYLI
ncbi:MAG: Ig-like domain-containing protein [Methanobrevibacter sp.]|uniref:Ig-like domain-containing protein n=1 Tax=Methanobrevibacter sp. TaxID=66852 RepID=UPI001B64A746|nr:Ig-like domain repeat protein [Methanobrevibacter sp.]MBP3791756.1 Ig-like domain-containing protein [Methanobrevibacter sp.]